MKDIKLKEWLKEKNATRGQAKTDALKEVAKALGTTMQTARTAVKHGREVYLVISERGKILRAWEKKAVPNKKQPARVTTKKAA